MKKILPLFLCFLLLAGCGSKRIPDWTYTGYNQLEDFKKSYLAGDDKIAVLHFSKGLEEIKKSGDLDILAKAYLTKYAVQTAVLEAIDDDMYLKIAAAQSMPENGNFHNFLKGNVDQVESRFLPKQYRDLMEAFRKGNIADIPAECTKIEDSLSRLIAIGIIIQYREYGEELLQSAVDTASANGWKKALLVYLEKLADYYKVKKEPEKADSVRKRIDLMK
jgi:hypothetical protein